MSKFKPDLAQRTALWRANGGRCIYCREYVSFLDLEIDHIIPENTPADRLREMVCELDLGETFDVNSFSNLVPTHRHCNSKKADTLFSESSLRFYLGTWRGKQPVVEREYNNLVCQTSNERLLTTVASRIEAGQLSLRELVAFVEGSAPGGTDRTSEPLVVCFGLNVAELVQKAELPAEAPGDYPALCDWLEERLLVRIRQEIPSLSAQTEASARNGETLSIRMAFWSLDLDHLGNYDLSPWEILEIAPYSDIYEEAWDDLFPQAVVQTHHAMIADRD